MVQIRLLLPVILGALVSASPLLPQRSASKRGQGPISMGYVFVRPVADQNPTFGVSNISLNKYDQLNYAYAITTSDGLPHLDDDDVSILPHMVEVAHEANVSFILTVGGKEGSVYFSSIVATSDNRTSFIAELQSLAIYFSFQGADIDWNQQGMGCNIMSSDDIDNYLKLFQDMRNNAFWKNRIISAAVPPKPWRDASGNPSTNLSEFAKVLDHIEIQAYDIWTSANATVGPNSPMDDGCAPAGDQGGSVTSAVKAWMDAGFSADQILLGVPSYGHMYNVQNTTASGAIAPYPKIDKSKPPPPGDQWTDRAGVDECGNQIPAGDTITFWGMIENRYLDDTGKNQSGIEYRFDPCSQTPYVYNPKTGVEIAYDDVESFTAKGAYIKSAKLGGFAMWEVGADSQDILLDSIRKTMN